MSMALVSVQPAHAQFGGLERTEVKEGYEIRAGETNILVFRPSVRVGAQTTGGIHEPNAEWTGSAKANLIAALEDVHGAQGTNLVMVPDQEGEMADLVEEYTALFGTVAGSVLAHKMTYGNRLPTKKDRFDWTLGEEAARLKELGGDYGLFFLTYDSYGSTGRKVLQGLALVLGGGFVPSGVHVGYAGLVDLETGELVWLNVDTSMGGDPRTVEGAQKRVAQLMEEFPRKAAGQPGTDPEGRVIVLPPPTAEDGSVLPPDDEPAAEDVEEGQ
ncbi:aspartyl/glutamyl-tRNA amidotransferase subunit B [Erythrobacter sp. SD-21]|nr:aspartyl/glutamyl-tRNA amidotransferase subunit B [Erythrobacter sp. SD-21]